MDGSRENDDMSFFGPRALFSGFLNLAVDSLLVFFPGGSEFSTSNQPLSNLLDLLDQMDLNFLCKTTWDLSRYLHVLGWYAMV